MDTVFTRTARPVEGPRHHSARESWAPRTRRTVTSHDAVARSATPLVATVGRWP